MADQPYKRPPITEAIIEIRFAVPGDSSALSKATARFKEFYALEHQVKNVSIGLGLPPRAEDAPIAQVNQELGYRRTSLDLTEILLLWPSSFVISQMAPYPGWGDFFARFTRDWTEWKKMAGFRKIARVGVRYINRIDIPMEGRAVIEEAEFLNVYPHLPEQLGPNAGYGVQAVLGLRDIGCKLVLNSSVVPAPLLDHASFLVDQDISKEVDPPQRDDHIYELLNQIRVKKNETFEACITNRARELFQR